MTRRIPVLGRFSSDYPPPATVDAIILRALEEDAAFDDLSTKVLVSKDARIAGRVVAKEAGVLAGAKTFRRTMELVGQTSLVVCGGLSEGARFQSGDVVIEIEAPARVLLSGERTALNFLQRLTGIATRTRSFVDACGGKIAITDTRKTTPGLRALEKYAVSVGGGVSHRPDLKSMVMLKENHIALAGGMREAVAQVRGNEASRDIPLTVEARTFDEALEAAHLGVDRILLDNMSPPLLRRVAEVLGAPGERPELEASGGVTLDNIAAIADAGVDVASIGALTHSVRAIDFSFLLNNVEALE